MSDYSFEEYKIQGEPSQKVKAENWGIAIGLQAVDNLTASKYLIQTAKENIEGKITSQEVVERITDYYSKLNQKDTKENERQAEADKVSAKIAEILSTNSFTFSPRTLMFIHQELFYDVFPKLAGVVRSYEIEKKEKVLNGDTVMYGIAKDIKKALEYDFDIEKDFKYKGLSKQEKVNKIADFISNIWQIHPFGEGNTRAVAVFAIKYLRALGFDTNNEYFEKNSKYFRDALVRANYQDIKNDIEYEKKYLYDFFENLLLGGKHILNSNNLIINSEKIEDENNMS